MSSEYKSIKSLTYTILKEMNHRNVQKNKFTI